MRIKTQCENCGTDHDVGAPCPHCNLASPAKYLVGDLITAQRVPGGLRVLWDETQTHAWGEFIADQDWIGEGCVEVQYEPTDFANNDPFYRRTMATEVALEAQS